MRKIILAAVLLSPIFGDALVHAETPVPARQLGRDALNGKWDLVVTPEEGNAKEFKDVLTFKGMVLTSQARAKLGMESGPYEENTRIGGVGGFDCTIKSKTNQGTDKWSGFVGAGEMQGNLEYTKPDGTVIHYSFKGTRQ